MLEGGLPVLLVQKQVGHPAHLAVHAGGHHHSHGPAGGDDGGADDHSSPVGQGGLPREGAADVFVHRHRFPRHGRLIRFERKSLQKPGVGGNKVPGLQADDIPGDHLGSGELLLISLPEHPGHGSRHALEGLQSLLGAVFLRDGNDGVHHDNEKDNGAVQPGLPSTGPEGEGGRPQKYQDHGVL